jgi:hypothetical protein
MVSEVHVFGGIAEDTDVRSDADLRDRFPARGGERVWSRSTHFRRCFMGGRIRCLAVVGLGLGLVSPAMAYFSVPQDGRMFVSPAGGSAGADSEFGRLTDTNTEIPLLFDLPSPGPTPEVEIGFFSAGTELDFYMRSVFGGTFFASSKLNDVSSNTTFLDANNSLGLGGSTIEQLTPLTWRLHLDDAASFLFDDDDDDVLLDLRLEPADTDSGAVPEPRESLLAGLGLLAIAGAALRRRVASVTA